MSALRGAAPRLSRDVWLLQGGSFANAFGNGLAFPFVLIYLHNVRGIALPTAGLVLAVDGLAAMLAGLAVGPLIDRLDARVVLGGAMLTSAAGFTAYVFVDEPWHAFAAATLTGIGNGAFWPSQSSLIAELTAHAGRQDAYAMQRVMHNLGIGVGGVVGGFIATTEEPRTYTVLLLGDAATFLVYTGLLALIAAPARAQRRADARLGYRAVLGDRTFVAFLVLNASLISVGFALLQDVLPAYAKNEAGVSEKGIGLMFLANTMVIVVAQLPVAAALAGRRRMIAYAIEALLWALAWMLVFAGGLLLHGAAAAVVFAIAVAAFALGECFHGAVLGPLVAEMARPGLLGRYIALNGMTHQLGWAAGRALGGSALAVAPDALWAVAAAVALAGGGAALAFERLLAPALRRVPTREPVTASAAADAATGDGDPAGSRAAGRAQYVARDH